MAFLGAERRLACSSHRPPRTFRSGYVARPASSTALVPGERRAGPADGEPGTAGRRRADPPAPPRRPHDRVADREAKARAARVRRRRDRTVKAVEDPLPLVGENARPRVVDRDRRPAALETHRDIDRPAFGRVLARVVDEHADQPVHEIGRTPRSRAARSGRGRPGSGAASPRRAQIGPRPAQRGCRGPRARRRAGPGPRRSAPATACPRAAGACASTRGPPAGTRSGTTRHRGPAPGRACARLDDRERRPARARVGGELDLASARRLDRRRDPAADGDRAQEHGKEQIGATSSQPTTSVRWASVTESMAWATMTRSSPTCAPAIRTCVPAIVAVTGPVTLARSVGRSRGAGRPPARSRHLPPSTRAGVRRTAGSGRRPDRTGCRVGARRAAAC